MELFRTATRAVMALAFVFAPTAAFAQQNNAPQPDYRTYKSSGTPKASTDKPVEQRDQEDIAFRAFTLACDRGSVQACFDLGNAYETGIGTEQNRPIAAILFRQNCAMEHAESCYRLGELDRIAEDDFGFRDAAIAFDRACRLGNLDGCTQFALALAKGDGVAQNEPDSEALWRGTCSMGESEACRLLAMTLIAEGRGAADKDEAVGLLVQQCSAQHRESCLDLLSVRLIHPGIPPRADTLTFACAAEDAFSCMNLADMALIGDGIPLDREYAYQLYRHVCELAPGYLCSNAELIKAEPQLLEKCHSGDMAACADLGEAYSRGGTVLTNTPKAMHYFEITCASGDAKACYSAGGLILADINGQTGRDFNEAAEFLELSCTGEYLLGCERLARELDTGALVPQDKPRAYALLEDTCGKGQTGACILLEQMFWTDPDAPLALANSNYTPPVSPDDEARALDSQREETDRLFADACAASTLTFRGNVYFDRICKRAVRSIGGYALRPGQAPWQALLWRPSVLSGRRLSGAQRVLCGGSLIQEGWILTAAHCLRDQGRSVTGRGYSIRLGVYNPRRNEGVSYPITQFYTHPQFDPTNFAYDIALVRYNPRAGSKGESTNSIARISLDNKTVASRPVQEGLTVFAYGWGWTEAVASSTTAELRGVRMQLSGADECERITGYGEAALCAGGRNGEQACEGDSGGPLITYSDPDRIPRVIGVVSAGRACGTAGEVSRYTRVGAVRSWISRTIARAR